MRKELFSHAAPIFPVADVLQTAEYYRDHLGFTITFSWQEPPTYAVVKRGDGVSVHFSKRSADVQLPKEKVALYVFVHDVDAVYEEFLEKEVDIHHPIGDREYGMRDFDIIDPNGFILTFGQEIPEERE